MSTGSQDDVVGVLGLGAMGLPMTEHLLAARRHVVFASRSAHPSLEESGAVKVGTPREVGSQADVVLVMLPDLPQLRTLLDGPDGLLADPGELLLLIGSTSSPVGVRELADELAERTEGRVRIVDCPVSGGVDGAHAGRLSIMAGGTESDVAQAADVLSPCGTTVHLGPLGAGQVAKACNQMVVAATILALGEASVLADRSGIDLETLWSLLAGGYAGSNLLNSRKEKLVSGDDSPSGVARYLIKDLGFAADVAASTATSAVLLPALQAAFDELVESGYGDRDIAVTRRFIAERDRRRDALPSE